MIVSQFRTFADLYGKTPLMVGATPPTEWTTESGEPVGTSRGFISMANTQTGKTVTTYPIQNTTQAVVSAVQGGQTVQKATAVSTANQSLFSQTLQKLLDSTAKISGTPVVPSTQTTQTTTSTPTAPWYSNIMATVKKYWLWIVLAIVAVIALAVIL